MVNYDVPRAFSFVNGALLSPQNNPQPPGSFFPVGVTNVTYVFVDSGGQVTCQVDVTVQEGKTLRYAQYLSAMTFFHV